MQGATTDLIEELTQELRRVGLEPVVVDPVENSIREDLTEKLRENMTKLIDSLQPQCIVLNSCIAYAGIICAFGTSLDVDYSDVTVNDSYKYIGYTIGETEVCLYTADKLTGRLAFYSQRLKNAVFPKYDVGMAEMLRHAICVIAGKLDVATGDLPTNSYGDYGTIIGNVEVYLIRTKNKA